MHRDVKTIIPMRRILDIPVEKHGKALRFIREILRNIILNKIYI